IKINQRLPVRPLAKNREIFANGFPIYAGTSDSVHKPISSTCGGRAIYCELNSGLFSIVDAPLLSLRVCGQVLRAIRSESAESRTVDCIGDEEGDRSFRASAGFPTRS